MFFFELLHHFLIAPFLIIMFVYDAVDIIFVVSEAVFYLILDFRLNDLLPRRQCLPTTLHFIETFHKILRNDIGFAHQEFILAISTSLFSIAEDAIVQITHVILGLSGDGR